jgi:hypothetical protein
MPDFDRRYTDIISEILRPLTPADGIPKTEIISVEKRLALKLPQALKSLYELTGNFNDLHSAYDKLIPLSELALVDGLLIFYEENQGVVLWGIREQDFDIPDPPVYQAQPGAAPLACYITAETLSDFLLYMLLRQAVSGAMPHTSSCEANPKTVRAIKENWPFIAEMEGTRIYNRGGQVIAIFDAPAPEADSILLLGARDRADMLAIDKILGRELLDVDEEWD